MVPPSISLAPINATALTQANPGQTGYLGVAHSAFKANGVDRGDIVLQGIGLDRLSDRKSLLSSLDLFRREADHTGLMQGMDAFADRPDRFEPRKRKRRPKKYDKLIKPRHETKLDMLK